MASSRMWCRSDASRGEHARVEDLLPPQRPDVLRAQRLHGHRRAGARYELDLQRRSVSVDVDDGADVAAEETACGEVSGQHHRVVFAYHVHTPLEAIP